MVSKRTVPVVLSDVYHVLDISNHLKAGIDMNYS